MIKYLTINADVCDKLLADAAQSSGVVQCTYLSAAKTLIAGIVTQSTGQSVVDYVCCADLFLSETLKQLEEQGSEIISVSQSGHQYTIFFRTETAYG